MPMSRFRISRARSCSYIVQWANRHREQLRCVRDCDISAESLFIAFICILATFAEIDSELVASLDKTSRRRYYAIKEKFSNDRVLFELGCYMYVRLDNWLLSKRPYLRDTISQVFREEFVRLFNSALQVPTITELAHERISGYGGIARSGGDEDRCHFHLLELLIRTQNRLSPQSYDFEREALCLVDAFEKMELRLHLAAWHAGFLPVLIDTIEVGTDMMSRYACNT